MYLNKNINLGLITKQKMKLGDSGSELLNFKEWMIAHRDANEKGTLLNVINLPADMQYKDKSRVNKMIETEQSAKRNMTNC